MNGSSPSGSTIRVRSDWSAAGSMCGYRWFSNTRKNRSSRTSIDDGCSIAGSQGSMRDPAGVDLGQDVAVDSSTAAPYRRSRRHADGRVHAPPERVREVAQRRRPRQRARSRPSWATRARSPRQRAPGPIWRTAAKPASVATESAWRGDRRRGLSLRTRPGPAARPAWSAMPLHALPAPAPCSRAMPATGSGIAGQPPRSSTCHQPAVSRAGCASAPGRGASNCPLTRNGGQGRSR